MKKDLLQIVTSRLIENEFVRRCEPFYDDGLSISSLSVYDIPREVVIGDSFIRFIYCDAEKEVKNGNWRFGKYSGKLLFISKQENLLENVKDLALDAIKINQKLNYSFIAIILEKLILNGKHE